MIRGYRIWLNQISTSYGTQPLGLVENKLRKLKSWLIKTTAELDALMPTILDCAFKGEI